MTGRLGLLLLCAAAGTLAAAANVLIAASQAADALDGLWRYQAIAAGGVKEVPIDGYFLFRGGRFVQQSLDVGEPFDKQLAQAHEGSYEVHGNALKMIAEVGVVVNPLGKTPVDVRRNSEHHVTFDRAGDRLTLTFSTGTVQKFTRVGSGEGQVVSLDRGALALLGDRFILVAEAPSYSVGGSGGFAKDGQTLRLRPDRWFTVRDGKAVYARERVDAMFDGKTLQIPGAPPLTVVR